MQNCFAPVWLMAPRCSACRWDLVIPPSQIGSARNMNYGRIRNRGDNQTFISVAAPKVIAAV